jgi:Threonine dehydrogenase and related Zn-dependent dehydrogenases
MKTLIYAEPEKVEIRDMQIPQPQKGQVRIKVKYCGVCGSDIGIYTGKHPRAKAPLVLGHEFIGTIDEINGGSGKFKVGDRVSAYPLISCGHCFACKTGIPHVCQTLKLIGIDVDGGIAEYVTCDEAVLFLIDEKVSDKAASVIEPLAVIIRTIHQANFQMLDSAAIIGAGPIGILTGIVLKHIGASKIIISDIDEMRLAMCQELGFETVNSQNDSMIDYVNKVTDNVGVDTVFECSGSEVAALEMSKLCRIGGMICMTGVHKVPHAVNLQDINFKEQTLIGSRVYTLREFEQAVEFAKEIAPELEQLVTHIVPLSGAKSVFDLIKNPAENTVKVVIDCQS